MLVHVSSKKMCLQSFNISFESTLNKQQYGTKITRTELWGNKIMIRNMMKKNREFFVLIFSPQLFQLAHTYN